MAVRHSYSTATDLVLIWYCRLRELFTGNAHSNSLNPYFHSQTLLRVVPSASTSYSKTPGAAFNLASFCEVV